MRGRDSSPLLLSQGQLFHLHQALMGSVAFYIKEAEIETEKTLSNSIYQATVTLMPKLHKDTTKKENYRQNSFMSIDLKYSIKYRQTESKNTSKKLSTMIK